MKNLLKLVFDILHTKIFSSKTTALLIIQFFIMHVYLKNVVKCSLAYDYPCAPWIFPFWMSSLYVVLINMLEIIYYFSDIPYMQHKNMYQIIRCGRFRWGIANAICILLESFGFVSANAILSILCLHGHIDWTDNWGKLLHTMALTDAFSSFDIYLDISYESMQTYNPLILMLMALGVGTLVCTYIGMLMYMISLWVNRHMAVIAAGVMTIMVFMVEYSHPLTARKLSYLAPVSWMMVTKIGNTTNSAYMLPPLTYIYVFLITGIIVFAGMAIYRYRTIELDFYKED